MSKHTTNFTLVDETASINNEFLVLKNNQGIFKEIKEKGWLLVVCILIIIKAQKYIFNNELSTSKEYISFTIGLALVILILALVLFYIFKYNWKNTIPINTIEAIEIEKGNPETALTIITSNKRERVLQFRTLENQDQLFIAELQKRNSRIVLK